MILLFVNIIATSQLHDMTYGIAATDSMANEKISRSQA
jgi:hypothetical protein